MESLEYIRADIRRHVRLQAVFRRKLKQLESYAGWRLEVKRVNGHDYYYKVRRGNADGAAAPKRQYLGRACNPEVRCLQKRYLLEKVLSRIEGNLRLLRTVEAAYQTIDPNEMRRAFPLAYHFTEGEIFRDTGTLDVQAWEEELQHKRQMVRSGADGQNEQSFRPEQLRHTTACGIKVRSKSEVILSNAYFARGIPQEYEKELVVNGIYLHPDFTLWSEKDHRIILWEHFGMMHDPKYREQALWKIEQYIAAGFQPGVNLILTFDDADGNIDSLMIERILDVWF